MQKPKALCIPARIHLQTSLHLAKALGNHYLPPAICHEHKVNCIVGSFTGRGFCLSAQPCIADNAISCLQLALVGHDVGHNQLFKTRSANSIIGIFVTLFLGAGVQWWKYNHNTHHVTPNSSDHDPDIQVFNPAFNLISCSVLA